VRRLLLATAIVIGLSATTVETGEAKVYEPGQTADSAGLEVTVYGIQEPWAQVHQFPDPGTHYVAVDVQIKNTQRKQRTFSSRLGFHVVDGTNRQYDTNPGCAGLEPPAPDGQIPAKQPVRGYVCFQVPDGSTKLKLRVQGTVTTEGVVFKLTDKAGVPIPPADPTGS
jgi:hypothetical protein